VTKHIFAQWKKDESFHTETLKQEYEEKTKLIERTKQYNDIVKTMSKETGDVTGVLGKFMDVQEMFAESTIKKGINLITRGANEGKPAMENMGGALLQAGEKAMVAVKAMAPLAIVLGTIAILSEGASANMREYTKINESFGKSTDQALGSMDRFMGGVIGQHVSSQRIFFEIDEETSKKRIASLQRRGVGALEPDTQGKIAEVLKLDTSIGVLSRQYNVSAESLEKVGTAMYTRMNLKSEQVGNALTGMMVRAEKAGMSQEGYMNTVLELNEATKQFGRTIPESELVVQAFASELRRGTIGIQTLVSLTEPAKMGAGQQVFLAQRMGITGNFGEMMAELQKRAKESPKEFAQEAMKIITGTIPGGGAQGLVTSQMFAKTFGVELPSSLLETKKVIQDLKNGFEDANKTMGESHKDINQVTFETKNNILANKSLWQTMKDTTYISGKVAQETANIIDPTKNFGVAIASVSKEMRDTTMTKTGGNANKTKGPRAGGGVIPEDGSYDMHEGEEVLPRGGKSGGNVVVTIAPGSIVIGGTGNMERDLDNAFDKIKVEVLKEVDYKWSEAMRSR
jgi:hypothetical protein